MPKLDTGDMVIKQTDGSMHQVACCRGVWVLFTGWPETQALDTNCELVRKATPEQRLHTLHELARLNDRRGEYARQQLSTPSDPEAIAL